MKVGTRMTIATSVAIALTLAAYAAVSLRASQEERATALRRRLTDVATALRYQLEASGAPSTLAKAARRSAALSRAIAPLRVDLLPALLAQETTTEGRRIKAFVDGRGGVAYEVESQRASYSLPLRSGARQDASGYDVLGVLRVSSDTGFLEIALRRERSRTIAALLGIVLMVSLAVFALTRSLVGAPIAKLLTGVEDVAHGDLSHVLLADREDEIGDLATRFNEMTYSLRESRAEMERHNKARTSLEQRLFQTEKLATIGQLAAEIAHEVGTPLNVISGRAKGITRKHDNVDAVLKNAKIISEQSARITRIIQRLLDFARNKVGAEERELVSVNRQALSTMELLESKLAAAHIEHSLNREESLPSVLGNPDHILQVLTNLVLNATEAMSEGGGTLAVETSVATLRRPGLEVAPEVPTVVVSVSDSGPGIAREDREKIFEPFYSSKTRKGGTGLGLAVVHGIVKAHDGWIEVTDAPGGGTCFSVYFPAANSPESA